MFVGWIRPKAVLMMYEPPLQSSRRSSDDWMRLVSHFPTAYEMVLQCSLKAQRCPAAVFLPSPASSTIPKHQF